MAFPISAIYFPVSLHYLAFPAYPISLKALCNKYYTFYQFLELLLGGGAGFAHTEAVCVYCVQPTGLWMREQGQAKIHHGSVCLGVWKRHTGQELPAAPLSLSVGNLCPLFRLAIPYPCQDCLPNSRTVLCIPNGLDPWLLALTFFFVILVVLIPKSFYFLKSRLLRRFLLEHHGIYIACVTTVTFIRYKTFLPSGLGPRCFGPFYQSRPCSLGLVLPPL